MLICGLLILASFVPCQSGFVQLVGGLDLEWRFTDSDSVEFELSVSYDMLDSYEWVSLGFKSILEGDDTKGLDGIYLIDSENSIKDTFTVQENQPQTDSSLDASDDLVDFESKDYKNSRVYTWTRPLNTGDSFDNLLQIDSDYYVHYGFGMLSGSDEVEVADMENRGRCMICLLYTSPSPRDS